MMDKLLHPSCDFLTIPASHLVGHVIHLAVKDGPMDSKATSMQQANAC